MGAKQDQEADFIPGIYNYCDRWCDRCPMTHRCYLFHKEALQREKLVGEGKDPDNLDVVVQEVGENLKEVKEMIVQAVEERGIDLKELAEVTAMDQNPESPDIRKHPLHAKTHKYAMDCHRFLDKLCNYIHEEERRGMPIEQLAELQDSFEILGWYHMQIAVKIDRALSGKLGERREFSSGSRYDADGSAKVAHLGLIKSVDALTTVYEKNQPMNGDVMPLLTAVYDLVEDVNREFPGHMKFKRPGFED